MQTTTSDTLIESHTPPLPLFEMQRGTQVTLELKPYIQPFERILAKAELAGLLGMKTPLRAEATPYLTLCSDTVPVEVLQRRLAYWQRIGKGGIMDTTLQVRYEATSDGKNGATSPTCNTPLPNRRRLRYGPHGIHEYRGKFFPQLVKSFMNVAGLTEGAIVLDPMCGSGTTICEARALGMKAIGVELNPLAVEISQLKANLLLVNPTQLHSALEQLIAALKQASAPEFDRLWTQRDRDYLLRWFDPQALRDIAMIRTTIAGIETPEVQAMAAIGLSNILRDVSWQKNKSLRTQRQITAYTEGRALQAFVEEVKSQREKLLPYLSWLQNGQPFPPHEVITGDARCLDALLPDYVGGCDVLITSPPYATALPYIDTDRLSLIVLGLLPRQEHRAREFQLIGNREVTEAQRRELWDTYQVRKSELPEDVWQFIDTIAQSNHRGTVGFRRRNLPALLAKYFLDMTDALRAAHQMMRPGAYAFYVVGNNSTTVNGDRHLEIPTNEFLWHIGKQVGWIGEQVVDMELLPSRDVFQKNSGTKETILVFKAQKRSGTPARKARYSRTERTLQQEKGTDWNFHTEETQPHLHALHPYPARFIPQIPRKAIEAWTAKGEVVLDPFCGCGTTLLESVLLGRNTIGVDNNSVAHLISQAKTAHYTRDDLQELQQFVSALPLQLSGGLQASTQTEPAGSKPDMTDNACFAALRKACPWIPDCEKLRYWFDAEAIGELGRLKCLIAQLKARPKLLALAAFSAIIVRVSYQESDTRYARVKRPYRQGEVVKRFTAKVTDAICRAREIVDCPKAEATLYLNDSREVSRIESESVNLIVTSPPYLNAYDYHKYHRQRLHWIDGDIKLARDAEIGKHDTFTRPRATPEPYFEDMERCFIEWHRVLRSGGRAFIVIGDAIVKGQPVPVAERFLDIMTRIGFHPEKLWMRQIPQARKSFNRHHSRINEEHLLLFQRK